MTFAVTVVYAKSKADTTKINEDIFTAAKKGNIDLIKSYIKTDLIDLGMDINSVNKSGKTALMYAIELGNFDMINLILNQENIDVKKANKEGKTALMYAVEFGYIRIMLDLAIKFSANINDVDNKGNTALMYAVKTSNVFAVKVILKLKANKTLKNKQGLTALDIAKTLKTKEAKEIIKLLSAKKYPPTKDKKEKNN